MSLYDAFISYSHAKDKAIATALQSVVQKLGKPWYGRRALRVFRDDTSLSATPHLWPSIEQALGQSRFFVLLTSPEAAVSKWVNKEVAYWLDHNSTDTLLIGVTAGDLAWDESVNDFAWREDTPLPPILKGRFATEPKWVDLRVFRDGADARNAKLIELSADFAATIRGMAKEDLLSREVRQQRRALMLAWSAVGILTVLIGIAGWQWREAEAAKLAAEQQRDEVKKVLSQSDLDQASLLLLRNTSVTKPLALLSRSYRNGNNELALTRIWKLLQDRSFWVPSLAPPPDDFRPGTTPADPPAALLSSIKKRAPSEITFAAMSSDRRLIFTVIGGKTGGSGPAVRWRIWDRAGVPVTDWMTPRYSGENYLYDVRGFFSPDSKLIALEFTGWRETAYIETFDIESRKMFSGRVEAKGLDPQSQNRGFSVVKFVSCPPSLKDCPGPLLLVGAERGNAVALRLWNKQMFDVSEQHAYDTPIVKAETDQEQQWFMSASADGKVRVTGIAGPDGSTGEIARTRNEVFPEMLQLEGAPSDLFRRGNRLVARFPGGESKAFSLLPPLDVPRDTSAHQWNEPGECFAREDWKAPSLLFDRKDESIPAAGISVLVAELQEFKPRRIGLSLKTSGGNASSVTRDFNADVEFVCSNKMGTHIVIGLAGFVSQVWTIDLSVQIGQTINEIDLVGPHSRPTSFDGGYLSPRGKVLVAKTGFWNPPNTQLTWYSVWDVQSGIPMSDRILFDADDKAIPDGVMFSTDGTQVALTSGCARGNCEYVKLVQLRPPENLQGKLPAIAEALAGLRYNQQGALEPIPDLERVRILEDLHF
jgi:hypothetical protein